MDGFTDNASAYLYVSRTLANGVRGTQLSYDVTSFNPATGVYSENWGYGTIPNSSFTIKGRVSTLKIDTSTVGGDFVNSGCTFDPAILVQDCGPRPGGPIVVIFTASQSISSYQTSGVTKYRMPENWYIITGTSEYVYAKATASILGITLPNAAGQTGTNHNTTVVIQKR